MPNSFQFELVSPEKLVLSKQAALVNVPGGEGDYGVLAGHAPMITTVRPGVVEVFADDHGAPADRIFVAGGFAEVTNERCTVLAEQATPVTELNAVQLEEQAKNFAEDINLAKTHGERAAAEEQLALTKAKLQVIAGSGGH